MGDRGLGDQVTNLQQVRNYIQCHCYNYSENKTVYVIKQTTHM